MKLTNGLLLGCAWTALCTGIPLASAQDAPASSGGAPGPTQVAQATALEEIVVTARRRAESAQDTPVSVSAFSGDALSEKNVHELEDLNSQVPGFRLAQEGGANETDVILRGLSKIPLGLGIPAVVTYFNDVPLPGIASNVPTFDMDSLQVLKGPQGTLFGRNTLGGAVVLSSAQPTNEWGGYIDLRAGNLGREVLEGAMNIPVVADKLELRFAGQIEQGDGYVKNLSGGPDMSNTRQAAWRISALIAPTDSIKDVITYDYLVTPERAAGLYLYKTNPGATDAIFGPILGGILNAEIASYKAKVDATGPFSGFTDLPDGGLEFRREQGLGNDLRVDITDNIQARNILGLRFAFNQEAIDTAATPTLALPVAPGFSLPFTLFDAGQKNDQEFLTDEQQLTGKSWDDKLTWVVGAFYNHDWSAGPAGTQFTAFSVGGIPAPPITALVDDENEAVYGQVGIDLSEWTIKGLTLNLGYRYSWDSVHACGGVIGNTYADSTGCEAAAARHIPGGPGDVDASGSDPSWTVGLDWKASDSQFFYITSRRGYRGVNVNTPLFSSVYTTGGNNAACIFTGGVCPDLRPFQTTKPEKLTDVEIGSKSDFNIMGMVARLDVDGYWSQYKDALQFLNTQTIVPAIAPDSPNSGSVGVNAADETIMGVELGATIKPVSSVTLSLNGAYTDSQIDSIHSPSALLVLNKDQITLPSPKFAGSASARWVLPVEPFDSSLVFNADIYATGRFGVQDGRSFSGYSVTNARIDLLEIAETGVDLGFYVKNMFDRTYLIAPCVALPTFPISTGYLGEPRTFGFELKYTFAIAQAPEPAAPPPAPPPAVTPPPAPPAPHAEAQRSFQVFFDFDKSNITAAAAQVIQAAADAVKAGNVVQITVTGHTDTVGAAAYNQALSVRRAAAVKQQLITDGVAGGEITAIGVGKSGLLVPTKDGVREPQNRRAEIVLM